MAKNSKVYVEGDNTIEKQQTLFRDLSKGTYFIFEDQNVAHGGLMVIPWFNSDCYSYLFHSVAEPEYSWNCAIDVDDPPFLHAPVRVCDVKIKYTQSK